MEERRNEEERRKKEEQNEREKKEQEEIARKVCIHKLINNLKTRYINLGTLHFSIHPPDQEFVL